MNGTPSDTTLIFKGKHGEVGKNENDYYSIGAGHFLCIELAKEIERLRNMPVVTSHNDNREDAE